MKWYLVLWVYMLVSVRCGVQIRQLQESDEEGIEGTIHGQYDLVKDFVGKYKSKYYILEFDSSPELIDISGVVLSGSINIYVDTEENPRPSQTLNKYSSLDHKSIFLQISQDPQRLVKKFYVTVYGNTPSVYILQVADKGMTLKTGLPTEYQLLAGEELPMVYNHVDDSDIVIINTRTNGWTEMSIGSLHQGEDTTSSTYKETYSTNQRFRDIIIIDSQNNNPKSFCVDCKYIVSVRAIENCKGSILIVKQDRPIYIREGYPQQMVLAKNRKQSFTLAVGTLGDFEISIASLSGLLSFDLIITFDGQEIQDYIHEVLNMDHYYARIPQRYLKCREGECINFPKELVVTLQAVQHQFFTLTVKRRTTDITLLEGKHLFTTLLKDEQSKFIYHNELQNNNNIIDIKLHVLHHLDSKEFPSVEIYIKDDDRDDETEDEVATRDTYEKLVPINEFRRTLDGLIHIQLKGDIGVYHIHVYNTNSQTKLDYNIQVTSKGIRTMRLGEASRDLVKQGESVVYEFLGDTKGSLGLEVFECFGTVQVFYAVSYRDLVSKQLNAFPRSYHRGNLYLHTRFQGPGVRYIVISLLEGITLYGQDGQGQRYAQFKLQGYFYNDQERDWHEYILPGGDSITKWTQLGFKDYNIQYQRVIYKLQENQDEIYEESEQEEVVNVPQVNNTNNNKKRLLGITSQPAADDWNPTEKYQLVVARDPFYLNTIVKCGYCAICNGSGEFLGKLKDVDQYLELHQLGEYSRYQKDNENEVNGIIEQEITLQTFQKKQIYFAQVIVYISAGWNSWPPQMFILYERMELGNSLFFFVNKKSYTLTLGLFIMICVAFIFSLYYYRKYKLTRDKLLIELHDVRDSANTNGTKTTIVEMQNQHITEDHKNDDIIGRKIKGEYQTMEES